MVGSDQRETIAFFVSQIKLHLGAQVLLGLATIAVLSPSDPRVQEMIREIPPVAHGIVKLHGYRFFGDDIPHAIIITSQAKDRAA